MSNIARGVVERPIQHDTVLHETNLIIISFIKHIVLATFCTAAMAAVLYGLCCIKLI